MIQGENVGSVGKSQQGKTSQRRILKPIIKVHIEKKVNVELKTESISDGLKALGTAEIVLKIDSTSDDFNALAIVENELKTDSTSDVSRLVGIYRRAENEHGDKLRAVISKQMTNTLDPYEGQCGTVLVFEKGQIGASRQNIH